MSIRQGNDEFILYIRKRYPACSSSNNKLGQRIWTWINTNDLTAEKVEERELCYWGNTGTFIAEDRLPKTAAQFVFDPAILPRLYAFLDELGQT